MALSSRSDEPRARPSALGVKPEEQLVADARGTPPRAAHGRGSNEGPSAERGAPERGAPERAASDRRDSEAIDALMRRFAAGEEPCFDELYRLLAPRVYSFCVRLAGSSSQADDVFQEAFVRLLRVRATYVSDFRALPWVYAITRSAYLDRARAHKRRPEGWSAKGGDEITEQLPASAATSPEAGAHARLLWERVQRVLLGLSEDVRSAYLLVREEGLSMAEAAAVLGTTEGAVKVRVHRATTAIREDLRQVGWASEP